MSDQAKHDSGVGSAHRRVTARENLQFKVAADGIAALEARAYELGITRSEMARRLLSYGLQHMPRDWVR